MESACTFFLSFEKQLDDDSSTWRIRVKLPWALSYIWRPCQDNSGNMSITELLKIGKEISLEGADLKEFITTQQEEERKERQREREHRKEETEREKNGMIDRSSWRIFV